MIFMTRHRLERLIESKVSDAIYLERKRIKEPLYTISSIAFENGVRTVIEEVSNPEGATTHFGPRRSITYNVLPRTSLPPMELPRLLNVIVEAAGIRLDVTPAVAAQVVARCSKVKK